jgi:hypothetical protein
MYILMKIGALFDNSNYTKMTHICRLNESNFYAIKFP